MEISIPATPVLENSLFQLQRALTCSICARGSFGNGCPKFRKSNTQNGTKWHSILDQKAPNKRVLSDIAPFEDPKPVAWQNTVRHTISLNKAFQRPQGDLGKDSLFTTDKKGPKRRSKNKCLYCETSFTSKREGRRHEKTHNIPKYNGIEVCEWKVNEVIIMRRYEDGCVNATQLLKALGLGKQMRLKILGSGFDECEKVQGGCAKYQGVWVPVEKAKELYTIYGPKEGLELSLLTDERFAGTQNISSTI